MVTLVVDICLLLFVTVFDCILALGTNKSLVETKSERIVGGGLIPKVLGNRFNARGSVHYGT